MGKVFEFNQTARLHLQPIVHACKRAITQFGYQDPEMNYHRFKIITKENNLCAWIDNDLFSGALNIIFHYLLKSAVSDENIFLSVLRTETNTCQLLISSHNPYDRSDFHGPISISTIGLDITDLESFQFIMEMHGGFMQLWQSRKTTGFVFEFNLLCVAIGECSYDHP